MDSDGETYAIDVTLAARACRAMLLTMHNVGGYYVSREEMGLPIAPGDERSIAHFLREQNPDVDDGYLREKIATWNSDKVRFIGALDRERFRAFVSWCIGLYAAELESV